MEDDHGKQTLDDLYADLWRRWEDQFDHLSSVADGANSEGPTVYAKLPTFLLRHYTSTGFRGVERLSSTPIPDVMNYVYRLDAASRPTHRRSMLPSQASEPSDTPGQSTVQTKSTASEQVGELQAVYRYGDCDAVLEEFWLPSGVPTSFNRVVVRGDHIEVYQAVGVHVFGGIGREMRRDEFIEFIRSDTRDAAFLEDMNARLEDMYGSQMWAQHALTVGFKFSLVIEQYTFDEGRPISGRTLAQRSGEPPRYGTISYVYSPAGVLERILSEFPGEAPVIRWSPPSNVSTKALVDKLSERIAKSALEVVRASLGTEPLVSVLLQYIAGHFQPAIIVRTHEYTKDDPIWPDCPPEDVERLPDDLNPELADLINRIQLSGRPGLGAKMMRQAAKLLSELVKNELATVEQFFVFAIDWELEGDQLSKVLRECGVDPEWIKKWKKAGLLSPTA